MFIFVRYIFQQGFASLRSITYILPTISKAGSEKGCCSAAMWIAKGSGWCLQGFLMNSLPNEAVNSPEHRLYGDTMHPTKAAHPCPQLGCIHLQEQTVGRLSFRGHSGRVINLEVITFSTGSGEAEFYFTVIRHILACAAILQPSPPLRPARLLVQQHGTQDK